MGAKANPKLIGAFVVDAIDTQGLNDKFDACLEQS
jgi:hypothetical protein